MSPRLPRRQALLLLALSLPVSTLAQKQPVIPKNPKPSKTMAALIAKAEKLTNAGKFTEALALLEPKWKALPKTTTIDDRTALAHALADAHFIWAIYSKSTPQETLAHFQAAYEIDKSYRKLYAAEELTRIGAVYSDLGEKAKALEFYNQALPLRRETGDKRGEATTLTNIGGIHYSLGEKTKALEFYNLALPILRQVGDKAGEATTLNNIGLAYDSLDEKTKALEFLNQAVRVWRQNDDERGEATTLNNLGLVYSDLGERAKALKFCNQALSLFRKRRGTIVRRMGSTRLRRLGSTEDEEETLSDDVAKTLSNIAAIYSSGTPRAFPPDSSDDQGLKFYQQALRIYQLINDKKGEANTLLKMGDRYRAFSSFEEVKKVYEKALALFILLNDREQEIRATKGLGEVEIALKNPTRGEELQQKGRRLQFGDLYLIVLGQTRNPKATPEEGDPVQDAAAIAEAFGERSKAVFGTIHTTVLTGGDANRAKLEAALGKLNGAQRGDTLIFYYAGAIAKVRDDVALSPQHYPIPGEPAPETEVIPSRTLKRLLDTSPLAKRLLIFDINGRTTDFEALGRNLMEGDAATKELTGRSTMVLGTTGLGRTVALRGGPPLGLLAGALKVGLEGEAKIERKNESDDTRDKIMCRDIEAFLPVKLRAEGDTRRLSSYAEGDDFPLSALTGSAGMVQKGLRPMFLSIAPDTPKIPLGATYALLIGTDKYADWPQLTNPVDDINEVGRILESVYGVHVKYVRDGDKDDWKRALLEYKRMTPDAKDQLLLYFAGHGQRDPDDGQGYLVSAKSKSWKTDETQSSFFSYAELRDSLDGLKFQHVSLLLDACYGGAFDRRLAFGEARSEEVYPLKTAPELIEARLTQKSRLFLASGKLTTVPDGKPGSHSPFAARLIASLLNPPGGILSWYQLRERMLEVKSPEPHGGGFGTHQEGGDFLLVTKSTREEILRKVLKK